MRGTRLRTLLVSSVLLPASLLVGALAATPAQAADTSCAPGDLCFWSDSNKNGAKGRVSGNNSTWAWNQAACDNGTWNNCAESIQNNGRSCDVRVYEHTGYRGATLRINRGTYISSLTGHFITWPADTWNKDIEGNQWIC